MKYHPSIEWNDEEGILQDPSTHAPHSSKKDFKVSSFFFLLLLLLLLLVNLLISCFVENFMVGIVILLLFALVGNFGYCTNWMEIIMWSFFFGHF